MDRSAVGILEDAGPQHLLRPCPAQVVAEGADQKRRIRRNALDRGSRDLCQRQIILRRERGIFLRRQVPLVPELEQGMLCRDGLRRRSRIVGEPLPRLIGRRRRGIRNEMMAEGEDQQRTCNAGPDLRLEPAKPGGEAHPAPRRLEIGPGEIVAEGVEAELLDLGDVLGRHVSPRAHRPAQPLVGADTEQESGVEWLRVLSEGGDG